MPKGIGRALLNVPLYMQATLSGAELVTADQQARSFLSPQMLDAFSKAFTEEFFKSNALEGAMALAMERQFGSVATH